MEIKVINPLRYPFWDDSLLSKPGYSFFHTSAWAKVLSASYGYRPSYFCLFENDDLSAAIPLMDIDSFVTGRRGVSLPFSDFCEPLVHNKEHFHTLLDRIIQHAKKRRWKYVECRGVRNLGGLSPSSSYYGHTLALSPNTDQILSTFRDSTRRNIRKAIKNDVEVCICGSMHSMKSFYRLHCATRKYHGFPPQPFSFFRNVHDHIIAENKGVLALAIYNGKPISGAVYFHFGGKAIYKYGASDRTYQDLRANNLLMWEAIRYYAKSGFKSLHFGRTDFHNTGLLQFKRGWRPKEMILKYYIFNLQTTPTTLSRPRLNKLGEQVFSLTPLPLLRLLGAALYRHMG